MFESAEIKHQISKDAYERKVEHLRDTLLAAQYEMLERAEQAVIVVIAGLDAAGKGETVALINTWLDPRHVRTYGFGAPTDEERERPPLWRYWRVLPPRGKIAVFFDSWYTTAIERRVSGKDESAEFERRLAEIHRFERMLTDEKFVVLKLWFHLSKGDQHERLTALEHDKSTRWRVSKHDWANYEKYQMIVDAAGRALMRTSTDYAPWIVVPGKDARYRALMTGHALEDAIRNDDVAATPSEPVLHPVAPLDGRQLVHALDLTLKMEKGRYDKELARRQGELARLIRSAAMKRHSLLVVLEGVDAAGKGGAIRRISAALDPRLYEIVPVAAPTEEERVRPYLWRFWRRLPRKGHVTIFDRSWYGRVLVERVEGLCTTTDWLRSYSEINDFEEQLCDSGAVLVKLWLHIDADEQLRRFTGREKVAHKRYKIGPEDWRNRDKWGEYEQAVSDMVERTSTAVAPWTLVEANDKNYARIKVLTTVCERLKAAVDS